MIWGFAALLFLCAPLVFSQLFARSLMAQMGIMMIFALSFNMLLGQSGMLSFGHAVYSGSAPSSRSTRSIASPPARCSGR